AIEVEVARQVRKAGGKALELRVRKPRVDPEVVVTGCPRGEHARPRGSESQPARGVTRIAQRPGPEEARRFAKEREGPLVAVKELVATVAAESHRDVCLREATHEEGRDDREVR